MAGKILSFISKSVPQGLFEVMEILYNLRAGRAISSAMKNNKADLIYERHSFFSFAATRLAKKYNIPIIIEVNEIPERSVSGTVLCRFGKKDRSLCFYKRGRDYRGIRVPKEKNWDEHGLGENKIMVMANAVNIDEFTSKGKETRFVQNIR